MSTGFPKFLQSILQFASNASFHRIPVNQISNQRDIFTFCILLQAPDALSLSLTSRTPRPHGREVLRALPGLFCDRQPSKRYPEHAAEQESIFESSHMSCLIYSRELESLTRRVQPATDHWRSGRLALLFASLIQSYHWCDIS